MTRFLINLVRGLVLFVFNCIFGCRHEHLTRPFTIAHDSYKVCLDCGHHVNYCPLTMRSVKKRHSRRANVIALPAVSTPANQKAVA